MIDNGYDIVAVTETWYKDDLPLEYVSIPGYNVISKARINQTGGGVAIYVRDSMNMSHVPEIEVPLELEVIWAKVRPARLPRCVSEIYIAVIYYPKQDQAIAQRMIGHIESTIDNILTNHPKAAFVVMGDFNQLNVDQLLLNKKFSQVVNKPTRGNNILDKIVTNIASLYEDVEICAPIGNSDHSTVVWRPRESHPPPNRTFVRTKRPMKDSSIRAFGRWLCEHDWAELDQSEDVGEHYTQYSNRHVLSCLFCQVPYS